MSRDLLPLEPETRVVLATAGGRDASSAGLATLRWGALIKVAAHERAVSCVHSSLPADGVLAPPDVVRAALGKLAFAARVRMAWLAHRLDETVAALAARDIPVLLLKGAAVGSTVYRSVADRPMGDLDLLVPPDRAADARAAAVALGWEPSEHEARGAFYAEHYHLPPLRDRRMGDVWLELHTGILPGGHPFALDADDMWRDARPLASHPSAFLPSPAHMVLHLCMHFGWAHMMTQGAWQAFRDLRQLVESGAVSWPEVVEAARRANAANVCYWTLRLARSAGQVAVPLETLAALRPNRSPLVLAMLARHLAMLMDPIATPCPSGRIRRALWRNALRDDIGRRHVVEPWEREMLFPLPDEEEGPLSTPAWLTRHVLGARDYLRYVRGVTRGN